MSFFMKIVCEWLCFVIRHTSSAPIISLTDLSWERFYFPLVRMQL